MTIATTSTAADLFVSSVARIQDQLARLRAAADNHFDADPSRINWGHVGDLGRIEAALKNACAVAFNEAE
ncbi:hypothetical protein [Castellaniella sp.]|uniref:hypothetical protein n=1 Tax=Castellaniella sp. TaxID=1955812 RepID=UPI002AFEFF36|nr:hypothetical protein [Castellaniella sp.]